MLNYSQVRNYAGKLGNLSGRALTGIKDVESKINEADKKYTAGVAGELYKLTPLKTFYETSITPIKTGLKLTSQIAKSIETGKPGYAIKGAFDLFNKYDPLLKTPEMSVNPFYRVAQSPYLSRFAIN